MKCYFLLLIMIIGIFSCNPYKKKISTEFDFSKIDTLLTKKNGKYKLSVSLMNDYMFLEHVFSWELQSSSSTIIAAEDYTATILVSNDLGENFEVVFEGGVERWAGCLTTKSGNHILWEDTFDRIWVFDKDWQVQKKVKTGNLCWHGSWSIAECFGAIMYAEYGGIEDSFFVWRSLDDGFSWEIVFSQSGRGAVNNDIRHFHTLQPDPFNFGYWYLSSGDLPGESKMWRSSDNGGAWIEITDPQPPDGLAQLHRTTAMQFDENFIYWGTDQNIGNEAEFISSPKTDPIDLQIIGSLGNLVRSMISTPFGYVFISERKINIDNNLLDFTIHISPDNKKIIELFRLSGSRNTVTGFTYSKSSIGSKGGIFFTFYDGKLIFNKRGMLRWEISENEFPN